MAKTLLDIQDLSIRLRAKPHTSLLEIPALEMEPRSTWALVGESGSGKSLLARSLMRLYPDPSPFQVQGKIFFQDKELISLSTREMEQVRGRGIGMVFQEPMSALDPLMTCGAQVEEALSVRSRSKVLELFSEVALPDPERVYRAYPHQISGGQKQRVALAMALAGEPELLIADEPTTALDVLVQARILELFRKVCQERRMSLLFITHDLSLVPGLAQNIVVLEKGCIQEQGRVEEVLRRPAKEYTKKLLSARPELRAARIKHPSARARGHILLKAEDLNLRFAQARNWLGKPTAWLQVLDQVHMEVHSGEILGLIGPSGCGKSTLSRIISGLQVPDSGKVHYGGRDLLNMSFKDRAPCVQMVFQDPYASLNPALRMGSALQQVLTQRGYKGSAIRARSEELMTMVGMDAAALHKFPAEFSGGQRQRLVIARALAAEPGLLICDEAVSALDVSVQAKILDLLQELRAQLNLSILFITHDIHVASALCDRVLMMHSGKIIEEGHPLHVLRTPEDPRTLELVQSTPGLSSWLNEH